MARQFWAPAILACPAGGFTCSKAFSLGSAANFSSPNRRAFAETSSTVGETVRSISDYCAFGPRSAVNSRTKSQYSGNLRRWNGQWGQNYQRILRPVSANSPPLTAKFPSIFRGPFKDGGRLARSTVSGRVNHCLSAHRPTSENKLSRGEQTMDDLGLDHGY